MTAHHSVCVGGGGEGEGGACSMEGRGEVLLNGVGFGGLGVGSHPALLGSQHRQQQQQQQLCALLKHEPALPRHSFMTLLYDTLS